MRGDDGRLSKVMEAGVALRDRFVRCGIARLGREGWPVAGGTDNEGCAIPDDGGNGE